MLNLIFHKVEQTKIIKLGPYVKIILVFLPGIADCWYGIKYKNKQPVKKNHYEIKT